MSYQMNCTGKDIIDVRDLIERFEELDELFSDEDNAAKADTDLSDEREDYLSLQSLLSELKGNGGDEQWRGDWYPVTLIREDYFVEYAEELVKDCEGLPRDIPSYIAIDWETTAENIKVDYSAVDFDGQTYYYR